MQISPVNVTNINGLITFIVKPETDDQLLAQWVKSLRNDHPPFPFGVITDITSMTIFELQSDLESFVDGWCDGCVMVD